MHEEARIYRFGDVEVDTAAHRVTRGGSEVALEPKAYAVLLALLARPGFAIERDELLDQVWGHRHVTPGVLNRVVAQLRRALGDEAENPRYIQTVHAVGYRFMCIPETIAIEREPDPENFPAGRRSGEISVESVRHATAGRVHGGDRRGERSGDRRRYSSGDRRRGTSWLVAFIALAFMVALAALAVALWWRFPAAGHAAAGGASVAVRPFTALGGSPDDAWFAEGLAVEMHDALASVPGLRVAALMGAGDPRRHADVRELGRELGVDAILDVSIRREGDLVWINASLSDTRSGFVLWSRRYEHAMLELFATQAAIAGEVVESMLGAMPGQSESLRIRLEPTRSVAAFEAYLRGLHLAREPRDRDRSLQAAEAFRTALAEDEGFARAQAALCATETLRFEYWNDVEAHARARAACARAAENGSAPPEVPLALGNLHRVDGEYDKALAEFRRAAADSGHAAVAHVGMAKVEAARGDPAGARRHFDQALALAPEDPRVRAEAGFQAWRDGDLAAATAHYRRAVALAPDAAGHWNTLGFLRLAAGDAGEAEAAFERAIAIRPSADVLANFGALRMQSGDHAAAVVLFRQALELDPGDYINWGNLADGLAASGAAAEEVRAAYAQAGQRARAYLALEPEDGNALAALGWYSANLGRVDEARHLVARAGGATHGERTEIALHNAGTLALLGDRAGSQREIDRARKAGVPEARLRAMAALRERARARPAAP